MLVVLFCPRKWAVLGMIAGVMFLTQGQQFEVAGFNLFPQRFLELMAFARVMIRREFSFRRLNKIDSALLCLYVYSTVVYLLRSSEGQAYQIGIAVDAFLSYFAFRGLLGNMEDFRWFLSALLILLVPYTILVLVESMTKHNPFVLLGGVEGGAKWMRNGRPRCFGSFRQPDTQGMFGATFLPLYVALAFLPLERKRAFIGIGLCIAIAWAANSGGAASAAGAALACWAFWPVRTQMRKVRWAIVGAIVGLALTMKAPIWYILARIAAFTGGDGWHRSFLMDVSYRHLDLWWLAGMPIKETADWFPYSLNTTGGADITNQFVAFGLIAGIAAIVLFIVLLTRSFSGLGKALVVVRSSFQSTREAEFLLWGFGVMLTVHIINWFGITYFDQMYMVWFMQLAAISAFSEKYLTIEVVEVNKSDESKYNAVQTGQIPFGERGVNVVD